MRKIIPVRLFPYLIQRMGYYDIVYSFHHKYPISQLQRYCFSTENHSSLFAIFTYFIFLNLLMELNRFSYKHLCHLLAILTKISMTGTSTKTPTTVAKAAPEFSPNKDIATATANSKKLLAPINPAGAEML